jgi:acyl-CoA reductase-like NAD-dependent aldehyde dehydrogenase
VYRSQGFFIAGRWQQAADGASMAVIDPAAEEEIGSIAVTAARAEVPAAADQFERNAEEAHSKSANSSKRRRSRR